MDFIINDIERLEEMIYDLTIDSEDREEIQDLIRIIIGKLGEM